MLFKYIPTTDPAGEVKHLQNIRYIFLDIDGVLNTYQYRVRQKQLSGKSSMHKWCPTACSNIMGLCRLYGAHIIISSNWKDLYELEELRKYFEGNGISSQLIKGITPSEVERHEGAEYRGVEIQQWLDRHATEGASYLIIDDNSTILPSQKEHFVHVNPEDGFANPWAVARAKQILSNGIG